MDKTAYSPLGHNGGLAKALKCCGICCVVLLLMVFVAFPAFAAYKLTEKHLEWAEGIYANCPGYPETFCEEGDILSPNNYTRYVAWNGCKQGYKTDKDFSSCVSPCMDPSSIALVDQYNSHSTFKLVEFSSRKGPDGEKVAKLRGWWLPSGAPDAPRVVLQHGNNANSNSRMQVMAAYLLRSIEIDALVPNLRGHGYSQAGFDKTTWSYEYPFDLLGAWDYAIHDPDGELGGKRPASKVGIMGFSMGGYVATSAFGVEQAIPAMWLDGSVFTVKGQAIAVIEALPVIGLLAPVLEPIVMLFCGMWTGVDIQKYCPTFFLPGGPKTKRKVAIVGSSLDYFVPPSLSLQLADFLESFKAQYEVTLNWFPESVCNGNAHCSDEFLLSDEYRAKLFSFWNAAFENTLNETVLEALPLLTKHKKDEGEEDASLKKRRLQPVPSSMVESTWLV